MFGLFRRSAPRPLSDAIQRAIRNDGLPPATIDSSQLRMVESSGRYSSRKVTYFRVFVPVLAAQQSLNVRRFSDLDQYQSLILRSGHVESDGTVVLSRPVAVQTAPAPVRTRAGRIVANIADPATNGAADASVTPTAAETPAPRPTP